MVPTHTHTQPIITAQDLCFSYPQATTAALQVINFSVEFGQFILLCGRTGSGKTTLLRQLVPALRPHGSITGSIEIAGQTGFVQQDPDNQIVTDLVFHELAFALENQGLPTQVIRRKVAEIATYFGLEYLLESPTHSLSGGQKQLLNLAATLVTDPDILVLDEPTSELDPIAAQNFLRHLARVNRELGTTIICCEHRLDEVLSLADRVFLMKKAGECVHTPTPKAAASTQPVQTAALLSYEPQEFVESCAEENKDYVLYLPEPTQIALALAPSDLPLDVRTGRTWLTNILPERSAQRAVEGSCVSQEKVSDATRTNPAITLRDLCFRYDKTEPYILTHLQASFSAGEIHAIVGGNASGKSTLLGLISGVLKSQLGKVKLTKGLRLAALTQNPKASFTCDTLREDLSNVTQHSTPVTPHSTPVILSERSESKDLALDLDPDTYPAADAVANITQQLGLTALLDRHPYDLSGGEAQKAALAKVLLTNPDILLLDEPTKGLDAQAKADIGQVLQNLAAAGKTILLVTHDLPFAARYTQTCSLLANGEIIATAPTRDFFIGNSFYTTPTQRMTRKIIDGCVTVADAATTLISQKD